MRIIDLDLPENAEDEPAVSPGRDQIRGRYAGVAWGLAERPADDDKAEAEAR